MPVGSEPGVPGLPRTFRPFGARLMGGGLVVGLYGLCVFMWFMLPLEIREKVSASELWILAAIGLLILAVVYAILRSKVVLRPEGLVVVNGYRSFSLTWPEIVAVRFGPGSAWVRLDVADGETRSVFAIQSSDGERARRAAALLRRCVEELS